MSPRRHPVSDHGGKCQSLGRILSYKSRTTPQGAGQGLRGPGRDTEVAETFQRRTHLDGEDLKDVSATWGGDIMTKRKAIYRTHKWG